MRISSYSIISRWRVLYHFSKLNYYENNITQSSLSIYPVTISRNII